MNKKPNIVRPTIGAKPTPEQLEEQAKRAFIQKRNSLAEQILLTALRGASGTRIDGNGRPDYKPAALAAIEAADYMMEKLYSVAIKEADKPAE